MGKKIVVMVIISLIFCSVIVYGEEDIYAIQLGVYKDVTNADLCIENMKKEGIEAFKISTSIHSVFHGTYKSQNEALKALPNIREHVSGAFVTKLSDKQTAAYSQSKDEHASVGFANASDTVVSVDEGIENVTQEEKQITIKEISDNRLQYTYKVMNDIELRGINGESKWFFDVDKELVTRDFKLNLNCRVNELIKRDISYVTIYMNNIPVKSMNFKNTDNQLLKSWTIDIPLDLINKGYNELKIRTHSRITDDPCEDDQNIANWIIIDGSTHYVIQYDRSYLTKEIAIFPRPFVGMHADTDVGIGVVIPHDYSDDEISAALTLIAYMEESGLSFDPPTTLIRSTDNRINDFDSLIYIGNFNDVPNNMKRFIDDPSEHYNKDAHIYRETINNQRVPVLLVVSNKGSSLMTAVKALKNTDIKDQMLSSEMVLAENTNITIKEEEDSNYIYLTDLGLGGIEVQGRNRQFTSIGFRIPYNKVLADEACVNLNLRYSDNLDFEKSLVSVYVNGAPIGSHKLEREKRDLDAVSFYIPEDLRRNSYYDVRVVFELIPSGIIDCERYLASIPWAYIQKDSSFYAPTIEMPLMLFDSFPYPFSRDDDLDLTTIVLPDQASREDLMIAGLIAELAGSGTKKNRGSINAIKGDLFNDDYHANNLIIFGTPRENKTIKTVNDYLWFKYDQQYGVVLSNEKIELLPKFTKSATFIELKESPYNNKKGMLTMTSLDKKSLTNAIEHIYENRMGFLTGDAAIASSNGDFQTFRFQKEPERPAFSQGIFGSKNMTQYILFAGGVFLLLLLGLGFYLAKNKKQGR